MSTDDPYALDPWGFIRAMASRIKGDAYWIVKLAFHLELAKLLRKEAKHGAA